MPFFAIVPIWAVCMLLALIFFFIGTLRFLSLYLLFCSTLGLILSIAFPFCISGIAQRLPLEGHSDLQMFGMAALALSVPFGFLVGAVTGFFLARFANRKLEWQRKAATKLSE
jgi:hypothetical protein